jgi:hypothetical protein
MTTLLDNTESVIEATPEQIREAVRTAIRKSGFTYRELLSQARSGDFLTSDARKSWVIVGGFADYIDEADR